MEIKIKNISRFVQIRIADGQTTIDLGLLNEVERDDLARTLIDAAFEMGPRDSNACAEWFTGMLARCGIELPNVQDQRRV